MVNQVEDTPRAARPSSCCRAGLAARRYVETGYARATREALEVGQHRDIFWITVLLVALGIVAAVAVVVTAWPVVGWIR